MAVPGLNFPKTCGILVLLPGMEPVSLAREGDSEPLDHHRSPERLDSKTVYPAGSKDGSYVYQC